MLNFWSAPMGWTQRWTETLTSSTGNVFLSHGPSSIPKVDTRGRHHSNLPGLSMTAIVAQGERSHLPNLTEKVSITSLSLHTHCDIEKHAGQTLFLRTIEANGPNHGQALRRNPRPNHRLADTHTAGLGRNTDWSDRYASQLRRFADESIDRRLSHRVGT